jgi:hypothetical protein
VLYTDGPGLVGGGAKQTVSQSSPGVAGSPADGDGFGTAIAVADLDCDGRTDLVVGVPGEQRDGQAGAGLVQVVWGSDAGLGLGAPSTQHDAASFGLAPKAGDRFGAALDVLEQAGQDGTPAPSAYALAIGIPGRDVRAAKDAGAVAFVLPWDGNSERVVVTQDSPGVAGVAEAGDRFGAAVSLGHLAGTSFLDAAVGVPGEDRGSTKDTGAVELLTDPAPDATPGTVVDQASPGVPGAPEAGDRFGSSLDAVSHGDVGLLAVGIPREDVGKAKDAGAVQVFRQKGSALKPLESISQDAPGVTGVAETGDRFGETLAFGAQTEQPDALAIGVPYEDGQGPAKKDMGVVHEVSVSDPGFEDSLLDQDNPGVVGVAEAGDHFGSSLARVVADEDVWLVGVPDDRTYTSGLVLVFDRQSDQDRAWIPGQAGVPAAGAQRFGAALASGGGRS